MKKIIVSAVFLLLTAGIIFGLYFLVNYYQKDNPILIVTPGNDVNSLYEITPGKLSKFLWKKILEKTGKLEDEKIVALTFDDGPYPLYTPLLLDTLSRYNVKATFFVIGKDCENYPELLKRISDAGHEIGNHSYSHARFCALGTSQIEEELGKANRIIAKITGKYPFLVRPPGGQYDMALLKLIQSFGYTLVLYSNNPGDWRKTDDLLYFYNWIFSHNLRGGIILMHSGQMQTIRFLPSVIKEFKRKGYRFVTVSELAKIKGMEIQGN